MTEEAISVLLIIGISFLAGSIGGGAIMILRGAETIEELEKEIDKWRELYFNEVDRYADDDPENELEP